MQIDESREQPMKTDSSMRERRDPGANLTTDSERHRAKQPADKISTSAGMVNSSASPK
jgi:hypothetical protein